MRGTSIAARMLGAGVKSRVAIIVAEIPGRAGFDDLATPTIGGASVVTVSAPRALDGAGGNERGELGPELSVLPVVALALTGVTYQPGSSLPSALELQRSGAVR